MGFRGIGNIFLNLNGGLLDILFSSDICMSEICIMKKQGKEKERERSWRKGKKRREGKRKGRME